MLAPWPLLEITALFLSVLHLTLEGYRWQLLPGYLLLTLLISLHWLLPIDRPRTYKPGWIRAPAVILVALTYLLSFLLPVMLPVPRLSPPDGPYAVGTRTWHWIDPTRVDPYAPERSKVREIIVQAWYPIEAEDQGERSPWMPAAEIVAPSVADWINLPPFFLNHLVHVKTQASVDAPIASNDDGFPVLLFSHGYGGFRAQNTNQMQHLASHGFVVFAPDHTYGSVVTVFPDDRIAYHNPETLPDGLPLSEDLEATRTLGDQWAGDLSFILDQLEKSDHPVLESSWREALDLERVGAFGHSTGGGAAIEFCYRDPRCQATVTMDPFVKPVSEGGLQEGLDHFALHMFSESWTSRDTLARFARIVSNSKVQPFVISVVGSAHYDFSDLPLLTPLAHALGLKGPINGDRMVKIANDYLLAYFRQTLQDIPSSLFDVGNTDYPEVIRQVQVGHP